MSWGNAIEKVAGIFDGLLGLSPEQRKIKIRNKIDDLERQRSAIIINHPNIDNSKRLNAINDKLRVLREQIKNS